MAAVGAGDRDMVLLDRKVGHHDIVGRCAADCQRVAFDNAVAHDFTPGGGEVDGADEECHDPPVTNNRTR